MDNSVAKNISSVIRESLLSTAKDFRRRRVAVALSGGVDSCAVLASLMEVGTKNIVIVSYTPETHESKDFQMARQTADNLGIDFSPAIVPVDPISLENYARIIVSLGYKGKVEVESLSPMIIISREAKKNGADVIFTGDQSDGYFCLSKWAAHNYDRSRGVPFRERSRSVKDDGDSERIDNIRKKYYREDMSCSNGVSSVCESEDVEAVFPFRDRAIYKSFLGSLWKEVNLPRIKEPIRLAFDEWFEGDKILVRKSQVNLHKGDSYFGDTMSKTLMNQDHLSGEWKTPRGLYSAMSSGRI